MSISPAEDLIDVLKCFLAPVRSLIISRRVPHFHFIVFLAEPNFIAV